MAKAWQASLVAGVVAVLGCAGVAAPQCAADLDGNGTVNLDDLDAFVGGFLSGGAGADLDANGAWNVDDVALFVGAYAAESPDADGDRVSACAEAYYQTDPNNPDTDGDGLTDGDETIGTTGGLDLAVLGADPRRRTIFVETDWFAGVFEGFLEIDFRPTPGLVALVQEAFAGAPLTNPDGSTGVDIFLDYGQGGAFTGGNQLPGAPDFITFDAQFNAYKAAHFDPARKGYFHYCIFANKYNSVNNFSSGFAEIRGDDFVVTLYGAYDDYNGATTFMHELGHNLGLRHGGNQDLNGKPNYNSVMNYRYTFSGVDVDGDAFGDRVFDYSSGLYPVVNENALVEGDGLGAGVAIDWNLSGVIEAGAYAWNVNCDPWASAPCGVAGVCYDSACSTLRDYDDWNGIQWIRLKAGDRVPAWNLIECDNWPGK